MFGATKGPNSSQYDFKGTSVTFNLFSSNPHLPLINLHLPGPEELAEVEHQEDLNPIREEDLATNLQIKLTNSKEQSTGML